MANETPKDKRLILWFKEVNNDDVALVGGKNASLGEMFQELTAQKVRVPNGFAVTAYAYKYFIESTGIDAEIKAALEGVDASDTQDLQRRGAQCRRIILGAKVPRDLKKEIYAAYKEFCLLEKVGGDDNLDVAVRSSATAEDLPTASFAGQLESFLNVRTAKELVKVVQRCMASLFTDRAIAYREHKGFDHFKVLVSVAVQRMVRSDLASSGVMFTLDTESGHRNVVLITGVWGLGENCVQGTVAPDEFLVHKPTLEQGYRPLIERRLGLKEMTMVYGAEGTGRLTRNVPTEKSQRERFCVSDDQVLQLARWGNIIEKHYTQRRGSPTPMDIEWALDGLTNELFIVQARPETVHSQRNPLQLKTYKLEGKPPAPLVAGVSVGSAIAQGPVKVIQHLNRMHEFSPGDVLCAEMTDPDYEPLIKQASAVVTNRGGRTCHAAIISRELGIPCIVGTGNATMALKDGMEVTIDCTNSAVYRGKVPYTATVHDLTALPKDLGVKLCLNIGEPHLAFQQSFIPNDGVGLARMEFIIANFIRAHPLAIMAPETVKNPAAREQVEALLRPYGGDGERYFIDKLAQGVGMIAAAFYPKRVILRFSDFKTSEYRNLLGGEQFEPQEENAMLGWRGASRYIDPEYRDAFMLEVATVKRVREEFGLKNLDVMVPFCRTLDEARGVFSLFETGKLTRDPKAPEEERLRIMCMCEIPANFILADQFLDLFDGFSIGSNDATQLILGVDRNSERVANSFSESNEAVKIMISQVIKTCIRREKYIGICGQAPSDSPEFAHFLLEEGIKAISLTYDAILPTVQHFMANDASASSSST